MQDRNPVWFVDQVLELEEDVYRLFVVGVIWGGFEIN